MRGALNISATSEAGLKANTSYTVVVVMDMSPSASTNSTWTYYDETGFYCGQQNLSSITFTVTTDANGTFSKDFAPFANPELQKVAFTSVILTEATA